MTDHESTRDEQSIRKLAHDLRNDVAVIAAAVRALRRARDDETRFEELCATVEEDGIQPLLTHLDELVDRVRGEHPAR
ncbi:MAG: hypothetical protein ACF8PN_03775 [Phycisphaerales bacterium]